MITLSSHGYAFIINELELNDVVSLKYVCKRCAGEIATNENQRVLIQKIVARIFDDPTLINAAKRLLRQEPFASLREALQNHRFLMLFDRSGSMRIHTTPAWNSLLENSEPLVAYQTVKGQHVATLDFFPDRLQEPYQIKDKTDLEQFQFSATAENGSNFLPTLQKNLKPLRAGKMSYSLRMYSDFEFSQTNMANFEKFFHRNKTPLVYSHQMIPFGGQGEFSKLDHMNELFCAKVDPYRDQLVKKIQSSLNPKRKTPTTKPSRSKRRKPSDDGFNTK